MNNKHVHLLDVLDLYLSSLFSQAVMRTHSYIHLLPFRLLCHSESLHSLQINAVLGTCRKAG